jgi:hypothetical protein
MLFEAVQNAARSIRRLIAPRPATAHAKPVRSSAQTTTRQARRTRASANADIYGPMVRSMLAQYNIRVRRWRTSMSGVAWYVTYRDGSVQRLIEAPRPKSPMSAAIFLHEVGHHAIGFNVYKPRCLEEYHAWQYALQQLAAWNIPITGKVQTRYERSMRYAVAKAVRRGIRAIPAELHEFAGPAKRPGRDSNARPAA